MSDYDFDSDPRLDILFKRCKQLDIPILKKNGNQYSIKTLKSACLKRKIDNTSAFPKPRKIGSTKPHLLPSNYQIGYITKSLTGQQYIVAQDRVKRRYWKKLDQVANA